MFVKKYSYKFNIKELFYYIEIISIRILNQNLFFFKE